LHTYALGIIFFSVLSLLFLIIPLHFQNSVIKNKIAQQKLLGLFWLPIVDDFLSTLIFYLAKSRLLFAGRNWLMTE
jgi:hypothetical protein